MRFEDIGRIDKVEQQQINRIASSETHLWDGVMEECHDRRL